MFAEPSRWAVAAWKEQRDDRFVQPSARLTLARVLLHRSPHLTPEKALQNAQSIIKALHQLGHDVGPFGVWGTDQTPPHRQTDDAFSNALDLLHEAEDTGRKPWLPDGEY